MPNIAFKNRDDLDHMILELDHQLEELYRHVDVATRPEIWAKLTNATLKLVAPEDQDYAYDRLYEVFRSRGLLSRSPVAAEHTPHPIGVVGITPERQDESLPALSSKFSPCVVLRRPAICIPTIFRRHIGRLMQLFVASLSKHASPRDTRYARRNRNGQAPSAASHMPVRI